MLKSADTITTAPHRGSHNHIMTLTTGLPEGIIRQRQRQRQSGFSSKLKADYRVFRKQTEYHGLSLTDKHWTFLALSVLLHHTQTMHLMHLNEV